METFLSNCLAPAGSCLAVPLTRGFRVLGSLRVWPSGSALYSAWCEWVMPVAWACVCAVCSVQLSVTLWTVARQGPLFMGFPSKNTGVGYYFLLQGIFPTQGSNPHVLQLLHCRRILYCWTNNISKVYYFHFEVVWFFSLWWKTENLNYQRRCMWIVCWRSQCKQGCMPMKEKFQGCTEREQSLVELK